MAEADSENRLPAEQLTHGVDGVSDGLRISRTVGEEDPVWIQAQDLVGPIVAGTTVRSHP